MRHLILLYNQSGHTTVVINVIFNSRHTLIKRMFQLSFMLRLAGIHLLLGVLLHATPVARVQEVTLDVKVCYLIYRLYLSKDLSPYMPKLYIQIY